jgi:hypothetical protein
MSTKKQSPDKNSQTPAVASMIHSQYREAEPTRSTDQTASKRKRLETCFVLMPFGGWFDDYYETIYKPAIEAAGFSPTRADDLFRPGTIVNDIWEFTRAAKIILADLTGRDPNVFYELGIAHTLAKPAILITDSIETVPFDLRALRVLVYEKNKPIWGDDLRDRIKKSILEVQQAPLEAVLPAFLRVKLGKNPRTVTKQEKAILELRRDLDLLRREIAGNLVTANPIKEYIMDLVKQGKPPSRIFVELLQSGVSEQTISQVFREMRLPLPSRSTVTVRLAESRRRR